MTAARQEIEDKGAELEKMLKDALSTLISPSLPLGEDDQWDHVMLETSVLEQALQSLEGFPVISKEGHLLGESARLIILLRKALQNCKLQVASDTKSWQHVKDLLKSYEAIEKIQDSPVLQQEFKYAKQGAPISERGEGRDSEGRCQGRLEVENAVLRAAVGRWDRCAHARTGVCVL